MSNNLNASIKQITFNIAFNQEQTHNVELFDMTIFSVKDHKYFGVKHLVEVIINRYDISM